MQDNSPYADYQVTWGSSHSVDAGVQVHNDIDGRDKDLSGDEDDD